MNTARRWLPYLHLLLLLGCSSLMGAGQSIASPRSRFKKIAVQEYQDRIYAFWLGQVVGNIYGLSYEFKFIEKPGPEVFPYGYGQVIDEVKRLNGAFSDDDTDIEYIYLIQMEKHGIEPTYRQLADAWKSHIKEKIWCANRAALALMRAGHYPPTTGSKESNPQWCQIDPQLENEIWAATAPGMIGYAANKSAWAARIVSDSFGLEPTIFYGAMIAAAFFEKNVDTLVEIGLKQLPPGSRFAAVVQEVKSLYAQYPNNWPKARESIANKYYRYSDYNRYSWPVADATLNGACGVLALLYGRGDFQSTLDLACAMGFDADNQAATMSGLLAIVNGLGAIPESLLFPLGKERWSEPFNDRYKNVSRQALPDASLKDLARRTAAQGELVILAKGGQKVSENGRAYYLIPTEAEFVAPFELNPAPPFYAEIGKPFFSQFYAGGKKNGVSWAHTQGRLPRGVQFANGVCSGVPEESGTFSFTLEARHKKTAQSGVYSLIIRTKNLAPQAEKILHNQEKSTKGIEVIRDGLPRGDVFYSTPDKTMKQDYYGYQWKTEQRISSMGLNVGVPQEFGGWFTSLDVEYLCPKGKWAKVSNLNIFPEINLDNSQWLKASFVEYILTFSPVKTTAIRVIGNTGGIEKDEANKHLGLEYYTAISELSMYQ